MLLAAGLSTRLKELSRLLPKPLMPVCNQPLLRWTAGLCVHAGIRELAINLHHHGELIRAEVKDGAELGASVTYSPEPEILGTGGGIKAMARLMPRATCVVVNAKIVADLDLQEVVAFHRRQRALATLVVRPHPQAERWGAIRVHGHRVTGILDHRRPGIDDPGTPHLFTGIHVLEPEVIDAIPNGPCCVIRTAYAELLERADGLAGYIHEGYFYDHSTLPRYLAGNLNLLHGRAAPVYAPGPLCGVDDTARVHSSAELVEPVLVGPDARIGDRARVGPGVVIGAGARVRSGVRLQECVVWPGTEVTSTSRHAVITPGGTIQVPELEDPEAAPR